MNEASLSAEEVSENRNVLLATFSIFTVGFYLQQTSLFAHFSKANLTLHSHVVNIEPLKMVSLLSSIGRIQQATEG